MGQKRHTPEQIIRKLREAEVAIAKGQAMAEVPLLLREDHGSGPPARQSRLPRVGHLSTYPVTVESVAYYRGEQVHTRLRDSPEDRSIDNRPSPAASVVGLPRVGGLHHGYVRAEAA